LSYLIGLILADLPQQF